MECDRHLYSSASRLAAATKQLSARSLFVKAVAGESSPPVGWMMRSSMFPGIVLLMSPRLAMRKQQPPVMSLQMDFRLWLREVLADCQHQELLSRVLLVVAFVKTRTYWAHQMDIPNLPSPAHQKPHRATCRTKSSSICATSPMEPHFVAMIWYHLYHPQDHFPR